MTKGVTEGGCRGVGQQEPTPQQVATLPKREGKEVVDGRLPALILGFVKKTVPHNYRTPHLPASGGSQLVAG